MAEPGEDEEGKKGIEDARDEEPKLRPDVNDGKKPAPKGNGKKPETAAQAQRAAQRENVPEIDDSPRKRIQWDVVKVNPEDVKVPERKPRERYWFGCRRDSPLQNVVVSGLSCQMYSGVYEVEGNGEFKDADKAKLGIVSMLTQEMVEDFKAAITPLVVRKIGGSVRVYNRGDRIYEPMPQHDQPLAAYVYLTKLPDLLPTSWRDAPPPPMAFARP